MPEPEQGGVWGILGGTFDPVHRGHLTLADNIRIQKHLAGVLLVPAYNHPFKQQDCQASYHHRVEMLRLALKPYEHLVLCEIEAEEKLSGYTVDTIGALKDRYPDRTYRFIIGADNLDQILDWHEPDRILAEAPLLVGGRPGYRLRRADGLPFDTIELIETEPVDVSSTALRDLLHDDADDDRLREWLPEAVLNYIRKEQLYR